LLLDVLSSDRLHKLRQVISRPVENYSIAIQLVRNRTLLAF